jgi:hypothetical protein
MLLAPLSGAALQPAFSLVIHTHGSISAPRSSTAPCATSPTIQPDAMLPCSLASDCAFQGTEGR